MIIKNKKTRLIVLFILMIFPIPAVLEIGMDWIYRDVCFPHISLNGENYAGLSRQDAQNQLENEIADAYGNGMIFYYQDQIFQIPLENIGIQIDTEKSVENLFAYGRGENLWENLIRRIYLLGGKADFQNVLSYSDRLIADDQWQDMSQLETSSRNFSYEFDGEDFQSAAAETGEIIDQEKLKSAIEENLISLKNEPVAIELAEQDPAVTQDDGEKTLSEAKNLLEKQVVLQYDSSSWKVDREDLGKWIKFLPVMNNKEYELALEPNVEQIEDYLVSLVPQINAEPVNAQLEFDEDESKIKVFALSQNGIKLDTEKSAEKIGEEIFQEENYTSGGNDKNSVKDNIENDDYAKNEKDIENDTENENKAENKDEQDEISIKLIVDTVEPELTTGNIDDMGITSLLATGESNFSGSSTSRRHNITVGASKFNGILVGTGEEFSFNEILGDVGAQEGYLPEWVIKQGETVAEYGGGLCQVSTTAFRAAVSAGMEVTERKNHAYAVSYYNPQGTDATIYPPHPDLVFINNTPAYLLIQTRIGGNKLYFDFYGTDDGRQVDLEGPAIYEYGEGGAMKTWWKQTVQDKDGNVFLEDTFYSDYKSPSLYPHADPLE